MFYLHLSKAYSFVPLIAHHWNAFCFLSIFILYNLIRLFPSFLINGTSSQVLPNISQLFLQFLIVVTPSQLKIYVRSSFHWFPNIFKLSEALVYVQYYFLWFSFIGKSSQILSKLIHFSSLGHRLMFCVNSQFHWFPIIGMLSQVLSKLIRLLINGTLFLVLSIFILSSLRFPSLGCHLKFQLSLFICSFDSSSLGHHSWIYISSSLGSLVFHDCDVNLVSI